MLSKLRLRQTQRFFPSYSCTVIDDHYIESLLLQKRDRLIFVGGCFDTSIHLYFRAPARLSDEPAPDLL
jgi:hypothetical protein